jgi:PAS domain S-box-containing protein
VTQNAGAERRSFLASTDRFPHTVTLLASQTSVPRLPEPESARILERGAARFDPRWLAVAFGLLFSWSEVTQSWRDWGLAGRFFSYTAFVPLQLASAAALLRAARRRDLPLRVYRALRLFGATFILLGLGSLTLAVITLSRSDEPRYTFADFFYLASYLPLTAGLLTLPRAKSSHAGRSRQALDVVALLLTTGILVYTHIMLRAGYTGLAQVLATIYPLLALVALLAANTALTDGQPVPSLRAWRMLVIALAANLLTDVTFETLWATGYEGPNWSLPISVAVNLAMLWAADWYARDPMPPNPAAREPALPFSPLPILLAVGGAVVLLLLVLKGSVAVVRPVLVTLIVLNVMLMVREFLLLLDATRTVRQQAAREGERRFEALVRHSTDLILVLDPAHVVRFASPSLHHLLGRETEQVVGRPLAELIHADDRTAARAALDELLLSRGGAVTTAVRLLHASGEWRRFEWSATNLVEEPSVRGLVLNCRDVTERTVLEDQLRQAQKMEVVGQLAGGVAHDFNNLLTTVLAGSELALQDLPDGHGLRQELENIRHAAHRGAALTGRLLAFSRPSGGQQRAVRIAARVAEAQPLLQRLLGEGYGLTLVVDPASGAARVNPEELEHALLNLVANARDAMSGGGTIGLAVADRVLDRPLDSDILPAPPGAYVVVDVSDTGHGMDRATRERLFQPFFTTKAAGQGTGLGLAGVFAFMRRSHGGITVDSAPGAGATFRLWFPRVALDAESGPRPGGDGAIHGTGTILLVEDDDVVRHATRRILAVGGYTVIEASGPAEARRLFAQHSETIDLLVTDVMMPGESGAALASALRDEQPGLPVLYISGYPGEDLARLGLRVGKVELLRKPFTVRELTERVREVLSLRAAS